MERIRQIKAFLFRIESSIVVFLLASLVIVGFIQVLLRKFLNSSIPDADLLITMLVYYIALMAAALASLEHKHIHIEVLTKFMNKKYLRLSSLLSDVFSIVILSILLKSSMDYLELQQDSIDLFLSIIPTAYAEAVIIPAFALMIIAFLINAILLFDSRLEDEGSK